VIDWRLAGVVAQGVVATGPSVPAADALPFEAVGEPVRESAALVQEYTGLTPLAPLPSPEALDRGQWIDASLRNMRGVIDPVADRLGGDLGMLAPVVRAAGGALLALEVGALSGVLAQRVLGQYEFAVLDPVSPARLLFVAPNLAHAASTLDAEADALLRWVALHEVTHALQFGAVDWLRPHLAERVRTLMADLEVGIDPARLTRVPGPEDIRAFVDAAREGDIASFLLGEGQRAQLDELQAFMAILEGYAEHVMDAVGLRLLPDLPELRKAMDDRRARDRTGMLRLFEKLIGMDAKLRQYREGKRFCDAVVGFGGIAALNRVWDGPECMPSPTELTDPLGWLGRVA